MAKTLKTRLLEKKLYENEARLGISCCFEVKIGFPNTKTVLTASEEYVDMMSVSTGGEICCYELKTSLEDLKSDAALSFYGHKNYLVLPEEIYDAAKAEKWFLRKLNNHSVGVKIWIASEDELAGRGNSCIKTAKPAKKKNISIGMQTILLESLTRSLAREAAKYYKGLFSGITVRNERN